MATPATLKTTPPKIQQVARFACEDARGQHTGDWAAAPADVRSSAIYKALVANYMRHRPTVSDAQLAAVMDTGIVQGALGRAVVL